MSGCLATQSRVLPYHHNAYPVIWPPRLIFYYISTKHIRLSGHPVSYSTISPQSTSSCLATQSHILLYLHKAHPVVWPPSLIFSIPTQSMSSCLATQLRVLPYHHSAYPVFCPPSIIYLHKAHPVVWLISLIVFLFSKKYIWFSVHPFTYPS